MPLFTAESRFSGAKSCLQETNCTEKEVRNALRPVVRAGRLHIALSAGACGRGSGLHRGFRCGEVTVKGEMLVDGRVQRVLLADLESPKRELVVWNVYTCGLILAKARRVRGRIH